MEEAKDADAQASEMLLDFMLRRMRDTTAPEDPAALKVA
jgi:hypothetical protein